MCVSALLRHLMLATISASLAVAAATDGRADDYLREELRIPMAAAGPRGLEAMLVRPSGTRRYPLALISHGAPRDITARAGMTPNRMYSQAIAFARRGFAALVVMRRGYGDSDGTYAESSGPCERRDYMLGAAASARDLRAAIDAMQTRTDVTTQGMIAVGQSAGGFASIALAANPPPGLAAVISFAGGRGSRADNEVCDEAALLRAFGTLGKTARLPMLWVYTANDKYFRPELVRGMHDAFSASGGRAQLIEAAAFGNDGHTLFANGQAIWTPMVDHFLREQNLGTRDLGAAPATADLPAPPHLRGTGKTAFATYLAAGPHKAFAVSPKGAFAFQTGQRSLAKARDEALAACLKHGPDCTVYAANDALELR